MNIFDVLDMMVGNTIKNITIFPSDLEHEVAIEFTNGTIFKVVIEAYQPDWDTCELSTSYYWDTGDGIDRVVRED